MGKRFKGKILVCSPPRELVATSRSRNDYEGGVFRNEIHADTYLLPDGVAAVVRYQAGRLLMCCSLWVKLKSEKPVDGIAKKLAELDSCLEINNS